MNDGRDALTSFVADEGTYVVSLIVTDGLGDASVPDRMTITIKSAELLANTGEDLVSEVGGLVT